MVARRRRRIDDDGGDSPTAASGVDVGLPLLLSADEVAALLGVSRSVFYRWDARGDVPAPVRIGRMKRWTRLDVLRWVERRCPPRAGGAHDR